MNEIELVDDVTEEFLEMLSEHKGIVYKVSRCYCNNLEDQNDLVQEIILQLWRSRKKYDDAYAMSTWVYRIALNVSISAYRKSSRRKRVSQPLSDPRLIAARETTPPEQDDVRMLYQMIAELKELDRALVLLFLDEKSHKEISEILGLSITNVATKLSRIRKKLKTMFAETKNDE